MTIQDYGYTHSEAEFEEMRKLLVKSYTVSRKPLNWRLALIENWNYGSRYSEPREYFTSRVHLWKNDGELVSFLIRYYSMTYLQVHPDYRFLEACMLDWAERHWAGDEACIQTMAYEYDTRRKRLLNQRGYEDQGIIEYMRGYDLSSTYPEVVLPPEFHIATLSENGNYAERIALENAVWNTTALDEAWFKGKSSSPYYSFDWDLVVVSPEGRQVASCLVWIDSVNQTAEIDPLGTHPDYRGRGLARVLVIESFRRMRASGIRYAYIGAESDNAIVNHLYESLQPIETYRGHRWVRRLR